ncbi:MAG: Fic family protein [Elusimicrobia bacterium]|nr:Fic family protein [Elusimicrobiota bacterium]
MYLRSSEDAADTIAGHWPEIVGHLTNGAGHVSHRTALHFNPYAADWFVSWPAKRYRTLALGPKRVHVLAGMPRPEIREIEFLGRAGRISTLETALLEVTEARRGAYGRATLSAEEVEEFLLGCAARVDIGALERIAERNDRDASVLVEKVGAILSADPSRVRSPGVRAVLDAGGADPGRLELFAELAAFMADLSSERLEGRAWSSDDSGQFDRFCFIAAYFSNYIEGTEFAPEDAAGIVYRGEDHGSAPDQRTLAATYQTYLRLLNSMKPPSLDTGYPAFEEYLRRLHRSLAGNNEALRPGEFKTRPNQAGGMRFVEPGRVAATLRAGMELSRGIASPFHRAAFLGFVVSEVHPFTDGNGRAARLVTDAHLLSAGFSGIVVTTRSRDLYLRALRQASRREGATQDWRAFFALTLERLYAAYRDLPVRSAEAALDFCRRENLEGA